MKSSDAEVGNVQSLHRSPGERELLHWSRLRSAKSPEAFYGAWLSLQSAAIDGVRCGVVLAALRPGGPLEPVAWWPETSKRPRHLLEAAEQVALQRRALALQVGPEGKAVDPASSHTIIARPIESGERVLAVVALEVSTRPAAELESALRQLAWGAAWLEVYEGGGEAGGGRGAQLAQLLELVASVFEHEHFRASATALATDLASHFGCERVSLGFLERGNLRLAAISHSSQFDRRANLTRAVEAAMNESLDQEATVLWPAPLDSPPRVSRAHAELLRVSSAGFSATFPIARGDGFVGAATLEWADATPLSASDRELVAAALAFAGPHLDVQRRDDRWLARVVLDSASGALANLFGPRHVLAKLLTTLFALLAVFLAVATGEYRVTADTVLEASLLRAATAPFDGYVTEAPKRAGDLVRAGELMARLDDRELVLERARLSSQLLQLRKRRRVVLASRDAAQANIYSAQIDQASAQMDQVVDRLGRTRIEAPFDGIIVYGDLSQKLGAPVARGDVLFELAPLEEYRVVLMVDERDIGEIARGQTGRTVLLAFPNESVAIEIEQVTPVSEAGEGSNRFRVEARLTEATGVRLRPGMEGVTKVEVDRRRLIWIWTHEAVDWLRVKLWKWLP